MIDRKLTRRRAIGLAVASVAARVAVDASAAAAGAPPAARYPTSDTERALGERRHVSLPA